MKRADYRTVIYLVGWFLCPGILAKKQRAAAFAGFGSDMILAPVQFVVKHKARITINPFIKKGSGRPRGRVLSLHQAGSRSGPHDLLASYIGHPLLKVVMAPGQKATPASGNLYHFTFGNTGFCDYELRISRLRNGMIGALGSYPELDPEAMPVPSSEGPDPEYSWWNAADQFTGPAADVRQASRKYCYLTNNGQVIPVWEFVAYVNGRPYRLQADEYQIYRNDRLWFLATNATVRGYKKNPLHGETHDYQISTDGSGHLQNNEFTTSTNDHERNADSGIARAFSASGQFIYSQESDHFSEGSVFASANRMMDYFKGFGFTYSGSLPIKIVLHAVFDGDGKNNAIYEAASAFNGQQATISLGDGDGVLLQNLGDDGDVIRHEVSHHIVALTVKEVRGESLILHEGLADYFTFASTGDPCLGESICPEGGGMCVVSPDPGKPEQSACLRTAEAGIKYNDSEYQKYGEQLRYHEQSQVISGLLWSLGKKSGSQESFTPVVYRALSFLVRDSGYRDLLMSLLLADLDLNQGSNACMITETIKNYSLGVFIADVDCKNPDTWDSPEYHPAIKAETDDEGADSGDGSGSRGPFGCGVLGFGRGGLILLFLQAGLMLFPAIWALLGRRRRHR